MERRGSNGDAHLFPLNKLSLQRLQTKSAPNSPEGTYKRQSPVNTVKQEERRRKSLPILTRSNNDLTDGQRKHPKRVRSFRTSSKGIARATAGDRRESNVSANSIQEFNRKRLSSENSEDSSHCCGSSSSPPTGFYRVCIMGADAVGKRTLINQFTGSSFMSSHAFDLENIDDNMLSLVIDNEESTLEFIDFSEQEDCVSKIDAYIVVFSVHERPTYDVAIRYIQFIRNEQFIDKPIILVANKVDLVRKRQINKEDAKHAAEKFSCKYIETSAALNHKVDDLLVGILRLIKLQLNPEPEKPVHKETRRGSKGLFNRLFHLKPKAKASCEDVVVP